MIKRAIQRLKITVKNYRQSKLKSTDFSIISNNCWGGLIYQHFNLNYQSPFVGLFLYGPDYIKLITDFNKYINTELLFITADNSKYKEELVKNNVFNKYPIGILKDIEIHFLHYSSNEEALTKWNRRKKRINYKNLIFKISERDLVDKNDINTFLNFPYSRKIALTTEKYDSPFALQLKGSTEGIVKDEFKSFSQTIQIIPFMNSILDKE